MGKRKIAIIGANGFVGECLYKEVERRQDLEAIKIVRGDDIATMLLEAEIIVHSANPAKRFRAESNPTIDFTETVQKTFDILSLCKDKKLVLISSLSARTQLNTNYGRHRKACEILVDNGENLIVRLGPMYGSNRKQDTLHDILNGNKVFLSSNTRYAYVDVAYAAKKVIDLLDNSGIFEIGAKNGIQLEYIKNVVGSQSQFEGYDDTQIPVNPPFDAPMAEDVLTFCETERHNFH